MDNIYAYAACTTAATASKDSSGGLFFDRRPRSLQTKQVTFDFNLEAPWLAGKDHGFRLAGTYLCDISQFARHCIEAAPLNSRAWVSQERLLSHRILHFTSTQLFWECYKCMACEEYPERLPNWARSFWQQDATLLKKEFHRITKRTQKDSHAGSPAPSQALGFDTLWAWSTFRSQYSRCTLTHTTDKLVAIRGIANHLSQLTDDQSVAGLWRSRIIEELCWYTKTSGKRGTKWRAPTWSWASNDAEIHPSRLFKFHGGHPGVQLGLGLELVELDVNSKASGELEDALMTIKCKPLYATFTPDAPSDSPRDYRYGQIKLIGQDEVTLRCGFDIPANPSIHFTLDDEDPETCGPQLGYVVVVQQCLHEGEFAKSDDVAVADIDAVGPEAEANVDYMEALFLRLRGNVEGEYERVGLILLTRSPATNPILKALHMAEEKVITLI